MNLDKTVRAYRGISNFGGFTFSRFGRTVGVYQDMDDDGISEIIVGDPKEGIFYYTV